MFKRLEKSIASALILLLTCSADIAFAEESLKLETVGDNVYAIVGPFGNRTPENLGNNATFGFVVTADGVVLVDPGGSYKGAAAIESVIRQVTDMPVTVVINSGGQDHRWLGNSYFEERGARIIASASAVEDQKAREQDQYFMLGNLVGDEGLEGTRSVYASETFTDQEKLEIGGVVFELYEAGPAHTPGDILVWLPEEKILFTGDVVYVGRMLGVMSHSNSRSWIAAFEEAAALAPEAVVPGHGPVTDLGRATADTYDYLVFLRDAVGAFMEGGGNIADIGSIDQSRFEYLESFEELAGRNAQQVYTEMEWE